MKIILDTNIFISYLLGNENASKLLKYILQNNITLIADDRLLHEYATIPKRPKFRFQISEIEKLKNWINENVSVIEVSKQNIKFNPDRQDSKIIEIANTACCDYIITNDKQLISRAGHLTKTKLIHCDKFIENLNITQ